MNLLHDFPESPSRPAVHAAVRLWHRPVVVRIVEWLAALVLLLATVFKLGSGFAQASPPLNPAGAADQWLHLVVIPLESVVAILLLVYPGRRWVHLITATLFFAFAAYLMTGGAGESCGCFGQAIVPPWLMIVLDLLFAGCFSCIALCTRRRAISDTGNWLRKYELLKIIALAVTMASALPLLLGSAASKSQMSTLVFLDFEDAIGERFDVLVFLSPAQQQQLEHGQYQVTLVDATCGSCTNYLETTARDDVDEGAVLVILNATGSTGFAHVARFAAIVKVGTDQQVIAPVPSVFSIRNGLVLDVASPGTDAG